MRVQHRFLAGYFTTFDLESSGVGDDDAFIDGKFGYSGHAAHSVSVSAGDRGAHPIANVDDVVSEASTAIVRCRRRCRHFGSGHVVVGLQFSLSKP